jgi:outer membrane protein OmpA-like peptidoglycan-associated protein
VRLLALLLGGLLIGGCATPRDRVILLPNAGGGIGKVAVLRDGGETILEQPYASARTGGLFDDVHTEVLDGDAVRAEFARELGALPPRPAAYNLYFEADSIELTAASAAESEALLREIAARPAAEVTLIGHTDTRGDPAHNEALSEQRAMWIRAKLIALGVSGFRVRIAGQGERHPAVATADEVQEPRNRRVEIEAR